MAKRAPELTPTGFQVLLALVDGEKHGYAIMQQIEHQTDSALRPGPGTLYRTISTLLDLGWIEESDERPDPEVDDARRRYYRLTDLGRHAAVVEAERLELMVRHARARLDPERG